MARAGKASFVVASPWFRPPVGLAASGAAGWALGPVAAWVAPAGIVILVSGFGFGLFVAGGRGERLGPAEITGAGTSKGRRVSLRGANLRNADLRGADLSGAEGADLRGANLAPIDGDVAASARNNTTMVRSVVCSRGWHAAGSTAGTSPSRPPTRAS